MIYGYNEYKMSEVCPCCGSVLWEELGFWTEGEYYMWIGFYYPNMYGWDMGLSHYHKEGL